MVERVVDIEVDLNAQPVTGVLVRWYEGTMPT